MDMLTNYIVPVVLVICLCIGYVMKNLIPTDSVNRYIPVTVAVAGVVVACWNSGWVVSPAVISIGLTSGLASTGMYEAFRNFIDKK